VRIAVIAPPWLPVPPVGYGGTELVLDTLCRGLVAQGHEVLLYATGDSACPVERAWTYDRHLGVGNMTPADELRHVMDAYEAAARWGADIVHDHSVSGPVWAQVHSRLPVITTNHGPFAEPLSSVYRRIAPTVPIIAISHHQASTARDVPVRHVIHHGLDTTTIPVGTGDGGYALFLGRMNETKGVHTAIQIARAAGVPLKIAAKMREPVEFEYYEARVKPLLGGDVDYLGEVGPTEKYQLLGEAVCLLNPIAWPEPFGMVMIESLACGTPVVGTPCGAAPEIVDDGVTGLLRSAPQGLADALGDVAGLERLACRSVIERRFSMARMAADHVRAYRSLIADDRAGTAELAGLLGPKSAGYTGELAASSSGPTG
jgi:glycosyltransferase involved in cell wall biosynthesis